MYVIRIDREYGGREPVTFWLKATRPVKFGERVDAMTFETKGEAHNAAADAKLVGWTLEDA
ncbi:MAG: hypothetical protein JO021_01680 [Alphaproteobacteria bacterium]|nr:hypothetical protein [Alphaproteobacteria bacterium]